MRPGGSLGFKGPEQLRAVRDGLVPMADVLASQQVGDEPLLGAEGIPFLVGSPDELKALHKVLRPEFDKIAEKFNQKILYMVPSPLQYMFLKVKTDKADGLKGVKIRGADKNTVDICNATGMAGVIIPWGELIPALASGRVDGVATSATSGIDGKFWEFLKYIYPTNHTWSCNLVNINLDAWKKLTPAQQKALTDLGTSMEPEFWKVSADADKAAVTKLQAQRHGGDQHAAGDDRRHPQDECAAARGVPAARSGGSADREGLPRLRRPGLSMTASGGPHAQDDRSAAGRRSPSSVSPTSWRWRRRISPPPACSRSSRW